MKSLNELVRDFQASASQFRQKVNDRLKALESEADQIKIGVESETSKLVTAELADDAVVQGECRRNLYELRQRLTETKSLIEAYRNEPNNPAHTALALDAIRTAAARERAVRVERVKTLTIARSDIENQMELLKARLQEIDGEIARAHADVEVNALKCILHHISPEVVNLPDFQRERYIKAWLTGDTSTMQACLKVPRQPRKEQLLTYTHGEPIKAPEPVEPRCVRRTVHVFGEGEVELPT